MKRFLAKPNNIVVLILSLWTILNIVQGVFTELSNDEAYYWVLSRDIGMGYYDHPPLFGWLMRLSTLFLGDTQLGVRLVSMLLQPLYLYLFWTLVRTRRSTLRTALVYCSIAFSLPLLQLYGFIATPDAPLLFSVAFILWAYRKFLDCHDDTLSSKRSIISGLLLGVAAAAAACYAKYHGLLVVGFLVLSNFRLFRSPRFYVAVLTGAVLLLPHVMWQWSHDWVSFKFHLYDRVSFFDWENVWLYILNFIGTFNPFIVPVFIMLIWTTGRRDKAALNKRQIDSFALGLKFITWGFLLFFLWSTRNVHVQPQWLLPLVFPMLYFVTRGSENRPALSRYLIKVGLIFGVMILAGRVFIMAYNGESINAEIFNNNKYKELADSIKGRPFISSANYVLASKMRFYGNNQAYACPSADYRSSHYEFMDCDSHLYMKPVAIEISDSVRREFSEAQLDTMFIHSKIWRYNIYYDTISNYIPSKYVTVECALPEKILAGQELAFNVTIHNPYPFNIPLGSGRDKFELRLMFRQSRRFQCSIPVKLKSDYIPAHGSISEDTRVVIPKMNTSIYTVGFTLLRYPYSAWYNSARQQMQIINPR